jgi:hypothetical protein
MKTCAKCKLNKLLEDFHRANANPDGLRYMCKVCAGKYISEYAKNNKDRRRNNQYKLRFGITIKDYDSMLESQSGVCAICKLPEIKKNTRLAVDHCHATKVVRGLLCNACNMGIGKLGDNYEGIMKAATYLNIHSISRHHETVNEEIC